MASLTQAEIIRNIVSDIYAAQESNTLHSFAVGVAKTRIALATAEERVRDNERVIDEMETHAQLLSNQLRGGSSDDMHEGFDTFNDRFRPYPPVADVIDAISAEDSSPHVGAHVGTRVSDSLAARVAHARAEIRSCVRVRYLMADSDSDDELPIRSVRPRVDLLEEMEEEKEEEEEAEE